MRVFIAIEFPPDVKADLEKILQKLKRQSVQGTFTRIPNLHVTLAFLGEVSSERLDDIKRVMDQVTVGRDSFSMEVRGLGKFMNHGECLYWCGIKENTALNDLQQTLVDSLKEAGFFVDDKPFKPHITLGRRCRMKKTFNEKEFAEKILPMTMNVTAIALMKSEHKEGKLVYTNIGEAKFKK